MNRERRKGNLRKDRGFTNYADSVYNFTLDVCASAQALRFVCGVHTHTQLMTHPMPRPARIQFESQVWRVQLRCTNAA